MIEFHHIPFDDIAGAAGLVAALSRQLASPRADLKGLSPVEVGVATRGSGADVYLSSAALAATERAFGPPPNVRAVDDVPAGVVWILRDGEKKFLGRGDVLSQLIPEPSKPMYARRTSIGIVKLWRDDKGYGVIESADIAPGHLVPLCGNREHRRIQVAYRWRARRGYLRSRESEQLSVCRPARPAAAVTLHYQRTRVL